MQQPNFLQVANGLRAALAMASGSDPSGIGVYRERLAATEQEFAEATRATDQRYTEWRRCVGLELLQLRRIRVELERIAAQCDEHGLDDVPQHPIVYTEREHLNALSASVGAFLAQHAGEWPWIQGARDRLEQLTAEAATAARQSAVALENYQVAVKSRVATYGAGVALLRELVRDASSARYGSEFDAVRECAGR